MRIERLELRPFGHFEDAALELRSDAALHVVYGPNEAGKSTILHALRYTLYGMPHGNSREPKFDFRFSARQLRTALALRMDDDSLLAFARSRSTKASVLDPVSDEPDATLAARRAAVVAAVPREVWDARHGLDQPGMRAGARALLHGAASDESIFAVGSGNASVLAVLEELRAARRQLLSDAGNSGSVHVAVKALKDATVERDRARRSTAAWDDAVEAHARQVERLAELRDRRFQLLQEHERLSRTIEAAPAVERRRQLVADLAAIAAVPDTWGQAQHDELTRLDAGLTELEERIARDTAACTAAQERRATLQIETRVLESATTIDALHGQAALVAEAALAAPDLRARLDAARAATNHARELLGTQTITPGATRAELARLVELVESADADIAAAQTELRRAVHGRDAARDALPKLDDDRQGMAALTGALEAAAGVDLAALDRESARLTTERAALDARARRIPGATLDADTACDVALPIAADLERLEQQRRDLDSARRDAQLRLDQAVAKLREHRARLAELEAATAIPDHARLAELRARRDTTVDAVDRVVTDGADGIDAPKLVDSLRYEIESSDAYADSLAAQAERVAAGAALRRAIAADEARRDDASTTLASLDAADAAWRGAWETAWAPSAIVPTSVAAMRTVRDELDAIRTQIEPLRGRIEELEARRSRVERIRVDLARALGDPASGLSLESLVVRARAHASELAAAERSASAAVGRLEQAEHAVREQERVLDERRAVRAGLDAAWTAARHAAGIDDDATTAQVRALLDAAQVVEDCEEQERAARDAVARVDGTLQRFDAAVRAIHRAATGTDAPDELSPERIIEQLRARLDRARGDARVAVELEETIRGIEATVESATADRVGRRAALRSLQRAGHTDDHAELRELDRRWAQRMRLDAERAAVELEVTTITGRAADGVADDLAAEPLSAMQARAAQTADALAGLDEELARVDAERDARARELGALERSDVQALATTRMRDARARLEELVPQYRELALQERMLATMLEDRARRDMRPIVERTSAYVAELTCGAWQRMVVEADDAGDQQILLESAHDAARVPLDGLSEGALDQLYLALRLAILVEGAGGGESMPLVLDDVLPDDPPQQPQW